MRRPNVTVRRVCFVCLLLCLATDVSVFAQSKPETSGATATGSPQSAQAQENGQKIFADLLKHNQLRTEQLRQYSATRTYAVSDVSGKVHAQETVRMEYVAPDKKTFVTLDEQGSPVVRHLVLNRLMESEVSAAAGKDLHDSAIIPANYTFHLLGEEDLRNHHCFVVQAVPKREDKYLFEGKVWIDSQDFAVVQIAGHPARKLSFWVTRADFVRQYEKVGNFWLPARDETQVEVRLYGKKILSIDHHTDSVNGVTSAAATNAGQQSSASAADTSAIAPKAPTAFR
jgi:outer membrane lipoprotein-sorting protein